MWYTIIGLVCGVVGFMLAVWVDAKDFARKNAEIIATKAELQGVILARKATQKKYDELYARFLGLLRQNKDLNVEIIKAKPFDERCGDAVFVAFSRGATRRELAKQFNISYPTICRCIHKRLLKQDPLF